MRIDARTHHFLMILSGVVEVFRIREALSSASQLRFTLYHNLG
jgi:hypothetical protein